MIHFRESLRKLGSWSVDALPFEGSEGWPENPSVQARVEAGDLPAVGSHHVSLGSLSTMHQSLAAKTSEIVSGLLRGVGLCGHTQKVSHGSSQILIPKTVDQVSEEAEGQHESQRIGSTQGDKAPDFDTDVSGGPVSQGGWEASDGTHRCSPAFRLLHNRGVPGPSFAGASTSGRLTLEELRLGSLLWKCRARMRRANGALRDMRGQVFISYSHEDEEFLKELLKHLKPYTRSGVITHWSDKQIASGSKWFDQIQKALGKTSVAVLLVSPSFLASDFIHEHELGPLLTEAEDGGVTILWIQLSSCSYEETPLKDYQAVVSPPEKPLAQMSTANRDETWVQICKEIKKALNRSGNKQSTPSQLQCFVAALQRLDLGEQPSLTEIYQKLLTPPIIDLPVPLINRVLCGAELSPEELDPLLKGEQLPAAREKLAKSLARTQKEVSILQEGLAKLQAQEQDLSTRLERLEKKSPLTPPKTSETENFYHLLTERNPEALKEYRPQLDRVRRDIESAKSSLARIQRDGEREQGRLEGEVAASRARAIVHLLREMRDRAVRLVEEPETTGDGFLLLLSVAVVIPALSRYLTRHTEEAAWADQIARRVSVKAEAAVRRNPQAVAQDALALVMTMQRRMKEGEQAAAEARRILGSVPAETLHLFIAKQQKLLAFALPKVEDCEECDPDDIAETAAKVDRGKVKLGGILDAIRVMEAEIAVFHDVAKKANGKAEELRRRRSQRVGSQLSRLADCRRIWMLLAWAKTSSILGRDAREFCSAMWIEAERRLGEPLEVLLAHCDSRRFGLRDVEEVCAGHQVRDFLTQAEKLRQWLPELEIQAAELDRASRKLAEQPQRCAQKYRQELHRAVRWAAVPWLGFAGALRSGRLIRRFAPALRSHHKDYRDLTRWSLPWLYSAALVSVIGTIGLGFAVSPVLTGQNLLWATVLALSALGYLLGFCLWMVPTIRLAFLVERAMVGLDRKPKRLSVQERDEQFAETHARRVRIFESRTRGGEDRAQ